MQLFHSHIYNPIMFELINQLPSWGNNRGLSLPSGLTDPPCPFPHMIGASHRFTRASHGGVANNWTHTDPFTFQLLVQPPGTSAQTQTSNTTQSLTHVHKNIKSYSNDYVAGQRLKPTTWRKQALHVPVCGTFPNVWYCGLTTSKQHIQKHHKGCCIDFR